MTRIVRVLSRLIAPPRKRRKTVSPTYTALNTATARRPRSGESTCGRVKQTSCVHPVGREVDTASETCLPHGETEKEKVMKLPNALTMRGR